MGLSLPLDNLQYSLEWSTADWRAVLGLVLVGFSSSFSFDYATFVDNAILFIC